MSKNIPLDVLLDHAGSDYDDLPDDVKAMCDEVETDLARVGIDVDADLAATADAEEPVASTAPASVTVTRDKTPLESFSSRSKARAYAKEHGMKFVDNGAGSPNRWAVASPTATAATGRAGNTTTGVRTKTKKATTATGSVKPGKKAADKPTDKKSIAIEVYHSLESAGTLKRSTFLAEMETKTGLSAKGASSYFYRIKGGSW